MVVREAVKKVVGKLLF